MKMKIKNYFIILIVLFILLFYNLFAYKFANKSIMSQTKYTITSYFNNNVDYDYIKATLNEDATINVFIKYNKKYYRFIFENNGGYKLIAVNQNIPPYIK